METLRICERCGEPYHWRKSTSKFLKFQFCSSLCESRAGWCIEDLLRIERDEVRHQIAVAMRLLNKKAERMTYWEMFRWMKEVGL